MSEAIVDVDDLIIYRTDGISTGGVRESVLLPLKSVKGELIRCENCMWYDPPHVEKDGQRYEYFEFEEKAFNKLVPQMVHAEYGVNVGGRCVREFYIGNLENKDIFRNENDFCSKAERKEQ